MMLGREHAMVARQIHTRIGYQRGQPRDEAERLEHPVRGGYVELRASGASPKAELA